MAQEQNISNYIESQLQKNETVVKLGKKHKMAYAAYIVTGIIGCPLFLIPTVKMCMHLYKLSKQELVITNKRIIGKSYSVIMDAPLDKIQNVTVVGQSLIGSLCGFQRIIISTAADKYVFDYLKDANSFKKAIMNQIEQAQEDKLKYQAEQMAKAMAAATVASAPAAQAAPVITVAPTVVVEEAAEENNN